jgi:predicted nucleic acid-binding protein
MALPEQYLVTSKNLDGFFNSLLNAQAPTKFTNRLFIGILKALGFVDSNGVPQDRYFKFLDQTQSKQVLAEAIKDAYSDLYTVNVNAHEMSNAEVKNKLKTLTQGTKSEAVLKWMSNTFTSLCRYADFTKQSNKEIVKIKKHEDAIFDDAPNTDDHKMTHELVNKNITTEMHYNIQIHLPETRDITVYDAIFKSLKEHLL